MAFDSPYPDPVLLEEPTQPAPAGRTLPIAASPLKFETGGSSAAGSYDYAIGQLRSQLESPLQRFLMGPAGQADVATRIANVEQAKQHGTLAERGTAVQEQAGNVNTLRALSEGLGAFANLDPETKQRVLPLLGPAFKKVIAAQGVNVPDSVLQEMAMVPGAAESIAGLFLQDDPEAPAAERQQVLTALRRSKPGEGAKLIEEYQAGKVRQIVQQWYPKLPTLVAQMKEAEGIPADQPLPVDRFLTHVQETPEFKRSSIFRRAVMDLTSGKLGEDLLTNVGLAAPSVTREVQKAGAKPVKPMMSEGLENYVTKSKTFQTLATEKGVTPEDLPKLPAAVRVQIQNEALDAWNAAMTERAERQGLALAQIKATTPEKASPAEREHFAQDAANLDSVTELASLYKPGYVGPARGRAGGIGEATGAIHPDEARFRAQVTTLKNSTIKAITGAALSRDEADRIMKQIPDVTNPPVTFEARLRQTEKNLRMLAERRRQTAEKTGVNVKDLPALPPPTPGSKPPKFTGSLVPMGKK